MIVAPPPKTQSLQPALEKLRHAYFPTACFRESHPGTAIAFDGRRKMMSAFQPVIDAHDGSIQGHHALLRAADERGLPIRPNELFDSETDDLTVTHLDGLARALHAVNYFHDARQRTKLFVSIDARLLATAPDDHRRYFDAVLSQLDVPTGRIVVSMPAASLDDPVTFVRSTISYGIRGYRVLAALDLADAHADLEHLFMAEPDYVAMDAGKIVSPDGNIQAKARSVVESLHVRGIHAVARRVESESQMLAARDAGFDLLQGRLFGAPS